MAKPRTMSEPIKFRLPLDLLPYLRRAAEKRGTTDAVEAQRIVRVSLEADAAKRPIGDTP